jgi:hypothetical protein
MEMLCGVFLIANNLMIGIAYNARFKLINDCK